MNKVMIAKTFRTILIFCWLCSWCPLWAQGDQFPVELSSPPGRYTGDLTLTATLSAPGATVYYSFVERIDERAPRLLFDRPLLFTAVYGEVRDYQLRVSVYREGRNFAERLFTYVIDKRIPAAPRVSLPAGYYPGDQELSFTRGEDTAVYFSFSSGESAEFFRWDGIPLPLTAGEGEKQIYPLRFYAETSAGLQSSLKSFVYTIDKSPEAAQPPGLQILSPVPGTFSNKQFLFIESTNLSWVKYTIDGSDPLVAGEYWFGPVFLDRSGPVVLKLVGKPVWAGSEYIRREVAFSVEEKAVSVLFDQPAGLYTDDFTVNLGLGGAQPETGNLAAESPETASESGVLNGNAVAGAEDDGAEEVPAGGESDEAGSAGEPVGETEAANGTEDSPLDLAGDTADSVAAAGDPGSSEGESPEDSTADGKSDSTENTVADGDTGADGETTGGIRFVYTTDGSDPGLSSPSTRGAISLTGAPGEARSVDLRVRWVATDGTLSDQYRQFYYIDRRSPGRPTLRVISSTRPLSGEAKVRVYAPGETTVYYTLDGGLPDETASPASDLVTLPGTNLNADGYLVMIARALDSLGKGSPPVFLPLEFSRAAPEPTSSPQSASTPEPGATPSVPEAPEWGRELIIQVPEGQTLLYEVDSRGGVPPDPGLDSPAATGELRITVPQGMQRRFHVKTREIKDGVPGEITQTHYIIDRRPPMNPVLLGLPEKEVGKDPVSIVFDPTDGDIFFQVTEDGSAPGLTADLSPQYEEPVSLEGRPGEEIVYRVNAIAIDGLGNVSPLLNQPRFRIDRLAPPVPPEPGLAAYGSRIEQKYHVFWELEGDTRLYYRIQTSEYATEGFTPYTSPLLIDFSLLGRSLFLDCYQEDGSGNRSPQLTFEINPGLSRAKSPIVSGVEEGGIYNQAVTLYFLASAGEIHYELTADGSLPGEVKLASPRAGGTLTLEGTQDEETAYRLRARAFKAGVWDVTSRELLLSFTIDRKLPESPRLVELEANGYYYTPRRLRFRETGDTVFYSLVKSGDGAAGKAGEFLPYREAVSLEPPPGMRTHYTLTAFAMDAAGNVSARLPVWTFTIDRKVVYVAVSGDDAAAGTRERPLRSLTRAVEICADSGRNRIDLARGQYTLTGPLELTRELEIRGGLETSTWELKDLEARSTITCGESFPPEAALLKIRGARVRLKGIRLTDGLEVCPVLIDQTGGSLSLEKCSVEPGAAAGGVAVRLAAAGLEFDEVDFRGTRTGGSTFLELAAGRGLIQASRFNGPAGSDVFTALRILSGSELELREVIVEPGSGRKTTGVLAESSALRVLDSKLGSGSGSLNAVALNIRTGNLNITRSVLNGAPDAGFMVGLLAADCRSRIHESIINIGGQNGATGIKVTGGDIQMFRSHIKGRATRDFLYLVALSRCSGDFLNNLIRGADSGDVLCVRLDEADTRWINNTLIAGTGSWSTTCFLMERSFRSSLINNILVRKGPPAGEALHLVGQPELDFSLQHNNLAGWEKLLHIDYLGETGRTLPYYNPRKYSGIQTVAQLNGLDDRAEGGPFTDNFSEDYARIFLISKLEEHHLSPHSLCVDSGLDVGILGLAELDSDIDGDRRPVPGSDSRPRYDVGADEYLPEG